MQIPRKQDAIVASILIVNWNTRELLAACLDAVFEHWGLVGIEVIVVDNASGDGSVEMVEERFPQVVLIKNRDNAGFVKANNQAAAVAKGRYIVLLNSDTEPLDSGLSRLIAYMEQSPGTGVVSGKLINEDGTFQRPFRRFPRMTGAYFRHSLRLIVGFNTPFHRRYLMQDTGSAEMLEVDWLSGAYLVIRQELIERGELFDPEIYMYYEDTTLCRSVWQRGYKVVYLPMAPVVHYQGSSAKTVRARAAYFSFRSSVIYFRKQNGQLPAALYRGAVLTTWRALRLLFRLTSFLPSEAIGRKAALFSELCDYEREFSRTV